MHRRCPGAVAFRSAAIAACQHCIFLRWVSVSTLVTALCGALTACSPARLISLITPTDGIQETRNVAYGSHERQQLDVYSPAAVGPAPRPVIVFFYGGGWSRGHRRDYLFAAEGLVSRGYVVVVPDYRLYPEISFPAFVEDGARAVAWAFGHIARHGGDPQRVFLMGHSAGAHIAAMLTFDERYLSEAGHDSRQLAGMIGLAGPYDFLPLTSTYLKRLFGPPQRYATSQPINYVDGGEPGAYLLHGEADETVLPGNTRRMAERIRRAQGKVATTFYPEVGHVRLVGALAHAFRDWAPVLEDVAAYIDQSAPGERLQASFNPSPAPRSSPGWPLLAPSSSPARAAAGTPVGAETGRAPRSSVAPVAAGPARLQSRARRRR